MSQRRSRLWPLLGLGITLAVVACDNGGTSTLATSGPRGPQGPTGPALRSCEEGARPGCPCDQEGARIVCERAYAEIAGRTVCGPGESICRAGVYQACTINRAAGTTWEKQSLGGPTDCDDACDPQCITFPDEPSSDLADDGLVADENGLTLPGEPGLAESACSGGSSGTCIHSICATGAALTAGCDATQVGEPSCVTSICAARPECCSGSWSAHCTDLLAAECGVSCYADDAGSCFACYEDAFDHDGDGYTGVDGDCLDCDPTVNAGAYDFVGNGIDDDCDGVIDNEVTACDDGLALSSSSPLDYARAIDLCRTATPGATGASRTWGVVDADLTLASGSGTPHSRGHAIQSSFGAANTPRGGSRLAALSTGTARTPGQSGYRNPSGQFASFNAGTVSSYPDGFPKNANGCPSFGSLAFDSVALSLRIRVPTNAKSFSYNFNFFSTEYPEWVCTAYNDHFVALLTDSTATPINPPENDDNISFDSNGDPVSVNIAFFVEPGCEDCTSSVLSGTGFDGQCWNQSCGGATNWLYTTAPVVGGEEVTLRFITWDQGDQLWDSTVLLDNFRWSAEETTFKTGVEPPAPPPTLYEDGTFVRTYDATGLCPDKQSLRWGIWSWSASTPSDSSVAFTVRTADTEADLNDAPEDSLLLTEGDSADELAVAAANYLGAYDTQSGGLVVDETLIANGRRRDAPFLRIASRLSASSDQLAAPTLGAWNLSVTCVDAE